MAADMTVASPCVGLCRIEAPADLCSGCGRSRTEIAGWGRMDDAGRARVWAALPERRAALGLTTHRLPWTGEDIRRFVQDSLRPRGGTWVLGFPGALAEFAIEAGEDVTPIATGDGVGVATARGAIHLSSFARMRALAVGRGASPVVALVVPREQVAVEDSPVLADLGPDGAALDAAGRGHRLYDLGLGSSPSRFCVRVADPALAELLDRALATPWAAFLPRLGPELVRASPPRVVTTPAGRVEVYAPIPPPGGASPAGPHTHLLPAALAAGHEAPPALQIPTTYAVGALHYPDPHRIEAHHAH